MRPLTHRTALTGAALLVAIVGQAAPALGRDDPEDLAARVRALEAEAERIRTDREQILTALLADTVERVTEGLESDRERALAVCAWIASNISNRAKPAGDHLAWFAERAGLCGERAVLAVRMLELIHVPAKVFNLYNLGRVGGGHSAVQVHFDGDWRYVDVMYAGYFEVDGQILSWEGIAGDPEAAVEGMVVFTRTLDRWGGFDQPTEERALIENDSRMRAVYTPDAIREAALSAGFKGTTDPKVLTARVDLDAHGGALTLGAPDRSATDVQAQGVAHGISEQLGHATHTYFDTFHVRWVLEGLTPGAEHEIRYQFYRWSGPDLRIGVASPDARVLDGERFVTTEEPPGPEGHPWVIRFVPESERAEVLVSPDYARMRAGLFVDWIRIGPVTVEPSVE